MVDLEVLRRRWICDRYVLVKGESVLVLCLYLILWLLIVVAALNFTVLWQRRELVLRHMGGFIYNVDFIPIRFLSY